MKKNTFLKKSLNGILWVGLWITSAPVTSLAMPVLKHVEVKNNSEFNLVFDGKVEEKQISSEFVNDTFQINLRNVAVYPAKIIPIQGKIFSKIFAYQYSPKLVRCRFTLRGRAADLAGLAGLAGLKKKIKITARGEQLTIKFEDSPHASSLTRMAPLAATQAASHGATQAVTQAVTQAAKEKRLAQSTAQWVAPPSLLAENETEKSGQENPEVAKVGSDKSGSGKNGQLTNELTNDAEQAAEALDEQALLQKVIRGTDPARAADKLGGAEFPEKAEGKTRLTGGKPLPPIWPVVAKLGMVILLLCLLAALVKKLKITPTRGSWLKAVGELAKKKLIKERDLIQVISTHHLDSKKSLAVVKVAGRLLVLGVSNEAINLITQLPVDGNGDVDGASVLDLENDPAFTQSDFADFAEVGKNPAFAEFLGKEKTQASASAASRYSSPSRSISATPSDSPSLIPDARSRIKNRLEGLKQL